jgi:DNA-binding NtrC family response regulator
MSTEPLGETRLPSPPAALVVEPVLPHLVTILSALSSIGFDITVAETFKDARDSVVSHRPTLLVTDVRLQDFNGLHLVLRAKASWPDLPAIVTAQALDQVLQEEAERLEATFLLMPTAATEIVAAVHRTLFRHLAPETSLEPIRAPFERRRTERRAVTASPIEPERRMRDRRRDPVQRVAELATAG